MKTELTQSGLQHAALIAIAIAVVLSAVLPVAAADVELQLEAAPQGAVVRLGDVAKIKGACDEETLRLASLPLVPAPAQGTHRFLRMREVEDLLVAQGENLRQLNLQGERVVQITPAPVSTPTVSVVNSARTRADRRAIWEGKPNSVVARPPVASQAVASPELPPAPTAAQVEEVQAILNRLVIDYLNRTSGRQAEWRATFRVDVNDIAKVLAAKSPLECSGGKVPWTGKQRFAIAFSGEEGPQRIGVYADVTATQPVVVAVQAIERGQLLTAADLQVEQWENVPMVKGRREPVQTVDALIGMEVTRSIQAGDAVSGDDVRQPLLVKRGEEISVFARGGGIQVRSLARARQDGARGEMITVESLEAKEPFDAVVTGVREAVVYSGNPAPEEEKVVQRPFRKLGQK